MNFGRYPRLLKIYANRLWAGRYSQEKGILIGIFLALFTVFIGVLLGIIVEKLNTPTIPFQTDELYLVWGVHATVVSLGLVGLSFAWSSIRDLPTSDEVIDEITFRLRSLETITYLFVSNLCIGGSILLSKGNFVDAKIAWIVGVLLVTSFGLTIRRFWFVLELLLHNSLDEIVAGFADDYLTRKYGSRDRKYTTYVEHFLTAAQTSIDNDRPDQLRTNLRQVEELLDDLLWHEDVDEGRIWEDTLGNYVTLHRRSLSEQDPELEKRLISSLYGLILVAFNYNRSDIANQVLTYYSGFFEQGFRYSPDPEVEYLIDRFENIQMHTLAKFEDANDQDSLEVAKTYVDGLIQTHANLWKTAIENESRGGIGYLHYLLDDVYQFRQYRYRQNPVGREEVDPFTERHQKEADRYHEEINHLKFAAYGWALHLYTEDEISQDFLTDIFSTYLEQDFRNSQDLSEVYAQLMDEEEFLQYWEEWNMQRELEQSYGPAMTGMAVNTWLLKFYCVGLIWLTYDEELDQLPDPSDSPLVKYDVLQSHIDKITNLLESYKDDYPLGELISEDPPVDERCESFIKHFSEVKDTLNQQEIEEIRELPISEDMVRNFEEHVNDQFENCTFRSSIEYTSGISNADDDYDNFTHIEYGPRRLFVDTGIPVHLSNRHRDVLEKYHDFVLENLDLDQVEVETDEIPNVLEGISAEVIVARLGDIGEILRDDDRSENNRNDALNSYFEFDGVPVLTDTAESFAAVALFENKLNYVEPEVECPISVGVTPGEDVEELEADSVNGEVEDYVKIEYTYRAKIKSQGENGIVVRISD